MFFSLNYSATGAFLLRLSGAAEKACPTFAWN